MTMVPGRGGLIGHLLGQKARIDAAGRGGARGGLACRARLIGLGGPGGERADRLEIGRRLVAGAQMRGRGRTLRRRRGARRGALAPGAGDRTGRLAAIVEEFDEAAAKVTAAGAGDLGSGRFGRGKQEAAGCEGSHDTGTRHRRTQNTQHVDRADSPVFLASM